MIQIPRNRQFVSSGISDVFGSLWSSFNLNLIDNPGHIRVTPRMMINTNNITDLDVAVGFENFPDSLAGNTYYWTVAGKYIWRALVSNGYVTAFAKDGAAGTPNGSTTALSMNSAVSDIVAYGKAFMVASGNNNLYCYTATTGQWINPTGAPNLTGGVQHPLCVYGARFYVVDANTAGYGVLVRSMDTSFGAPTSSGSNFLNLDNKSYPVTQITCMRPISNGIWIFTINQAENGNFAFKWDGATANDPNQAFIIPDCSGILSAVIKDDRPWCIDNNGRLLYFNGGTFVPAPRGRLPVKNPKQLKNSLSSTNNRWIHSNGMVVVDGKIRILINNENSDNGATIEENLASGIWEYDPNIGWYHINSLNLYTSSITDFGQNRVSQVGALYFAKSASTAATANGTILAGAQVFTDASATASNIYYNDTNDTIQKYGYFVTTKLYSQNVIDQWQQVIPRFKKFLTATDKLVIKARSDDPVPTEATITWVSTTQFTTTTDVSAYNPTTVQYQPEVEILQGTGGGRCAHITAMSVNAGTYTVTLDETITGATGTAKARFQNWKKIGSYSARTDKFKRFPVTISDTWIQLKVCLLFTGKNELDDVLLVSQPQQLPAAASK